ncbi:ATP synthase subunit b [Streptococcus oralis]|nr:ATP synthase subunit b [Streptococcus oralis]
MHVTVGELIGNFILIAGSFILLIVLVKKYAWSNLTSVFEERANKIAADIDGAEQARQKQKLLLKNVKMNWLEVATRPKQSLKMLKRLQKRVKQIFWQMLK